MNFPAMRFVPKLASLKSFFFNTATLTAATIGVAVALFALAPPLLEEIELNWLNLRFQARGPIKPGPAVVLAAIDEKSLAAEGRWPWPRSRIAALVDALSLGGSGGVIVMDLQGRPSFAMTSSGMYRGAVSDGAAAGVAIYGDEDLRP